MRSDASRRGLVVDGGGVIDQVALPALPSISAIFSGLVDAGITAMNGRPRKRAKYASDTAVDPLDASTMVVSSRIQPLQRPYRKSERASRCLSEPVGCTDSSFRYRSTPQSSGSGNEWRCVSAERFASASMRRTASSAHARGAGYLAHLETSSQRTVWRITSSRAAL